MLKGDRIDIRLSKEQKGILRKAARQSGQPLSSWMRNVLLREAHESLMDPADRVVTLLSKRDFKAFTDLMINPPKPNVKLRAAVKRFKERYQ